MRLRHLAGPTRRPNSRRQIGDLRSAENLYRLALPAPTIAAQADETWGTTSRGNQLFGEDLCIASAEMLGEHPTEDPWN